MQNQSEIKSQSRKDRSIRSRKKKEAINDPSIKKDYEDIEEYKLLRGIKAQNSGRGKDYIFELWYKSMGFQRRTQNLINRFNNYWRDLP